eukprot:2404382-Rhodomonas_salina.1
MWLSIRWPGEAMTVDKPPSSHIKRVEGLSWLQHNHHWVALWSLTRALSLIWGAAADDRDKS